VLKHLIPDELFSVSGTCELTRITLPDGVGVWGPSWYYIGDNPIFRPPDDDRPVALTMDELIFTDNYEIFWHC